MKIVLSKPVAVTKGTSKTATFTIRHTNWKRKSQSMVVRIQSSLDKGKTWDDEVIFTVPDPAGQKTIPYSLSYQDGFPESGLVRLLCEVTGNINFTIKGEVTNEAYQLFSVRSQS